MSDNTEPTSMDASKTQSKLTDSLLTRGKMKQTIALQRLQMSELEAENKLLKSSLSMLNPSENEPSGEQQQRLQQVYPHIAEMLINEGFKEAYRLVVDDIQRAVFNTQPDKPNEREDLYFQAQGMQRLLLKLTGMAKQAQRSSNS